MTEVGTGSSHYQHQQEEEEKEEEEEESVAVAVAARISSKGRLMKTLLINLPEDVLINYILLKVPMNSLLNLRCVCNYLRCLITSPAFVNMHLQLTKTLNKELVLIIPSYWSLDLNRDASEKPPNMFYSLNFNATDNPARPERVEVTTPFRSPRVFGSCNGLLCLSEKDSDPDRYSWQISTYSSPCIWNPTTKEYKELPIPSIQNPFGDTETSSSYEARSIYYGFGYDSTNDDYKVVRGETFECSKGRNIITEFQVYTLGTNTWRSISTRKKPFRSYSLARKRQGLFVNGALHWLLYTRKKIPLNPPSKRKRGTTILTHVLQIISLDIEKEEFREVQPPHNMKSEAAPWDVQVIRGCLCMYEDVGYMEPGYMQKIKIDVWLMIEDSVWTKLFTIVEPPLAYPDLYWPSYVKLLRFMENGEILILTNNKRIALYNPIADTDRCVDKLGDIRGHLLYTGVYIESLVSLKSGTYRDLKQVLM